VRGVPNFGHAKLLVTQTFSQANLGKMKIMTHKSSLLNIALVFIFGALTACGGSGSSNPPATPTVGTVNVVNSTFTGGAASVVAITGYLTATPTVEDTTVVYDADLTADCTFAWSPSGSLCNEPGNENSKTESIRADTDVGATWNNSGSHLDSTGVLIIDAGSVVAFSEARIFQMFSDGEVTQAQLSIHTETGVTPPTWDDAGWTVITPSGFVAVGAGATLDLGLTVTDPTVIALGSRSSRYIRVEVRNDGSRSFPGYIELRSLKLF